MKRTIQLLAIVIATVVIIYSCNNSNSVSPTTSNPGSISGQLTHWYHSGKVYLYLVVYDTMIPQNKYIVDTGVINSNGTFSIDLSTPPSAALRILKGDTSCHPGITFTQGVLISGASFQVYDSLNNFLGDLFKSNYFDSASGFASGQFFASYSYVNTSFSASGTTICPLIGDTVTYSVSGQAGWNEIVDIYQDVYPPNMVTKISVTNTEPAGGFWYVSSTLDSKQPFRGVVRGYTRISGSPLDR